MCDKVILENGGILKFISDCCKNRKMCDRAIDNYAYAFRQKEMCNKAVDTYPSTVQFVPDRQSC